VPVPPGRVRLDPMSWDEFDTWSERSVRGFADQQVDAGVLPAPEALAYARRQLGHQLPSGVATPLHLLHTVREQAPGEPVVGHLWMRVRPLSTEVEAFVFDVEVLDQARGRGLGRATMLDAERRARELGATVLRLNVFGHNTPALRLYETLGYGVTSTSFGKGVDDQPRRDRGQAPVSLRPMTDAELVAFRRRREVPYAAELERAGLMPMAEARLWAADRERLLPQGLRTPGHLLWTAWEGARPVGEVWLQVQDRTDGPHAVCHDLHVPEQLRPCGYESSLLEAAQQACRERRVSSLALSVLGRNGTPGALSALCAREGFAVTAQTMAKRC
jgi:ribosomal protein S18 acetylase RimI-like enzyme